MFLRLASFLLVLGYSRPLVGFNTESSELIQETPHSFFFLPPPRSPLSPSPFQTSPFRTSLNSAVSCPYATRQKPREQYRLPPACYCVNALASRYYEGVHIGKREVGAVVLLLTEAANQKAVVGSLQRVVVARARAPRDAAVQHCLEYSRS